MKGLAIIITAVLCVIYLLNLTFGVVEFIPDITPIVGNLDEATAVAILLACARYFGYDLSSFFGKKKDDDDIVDINPRDES